MRDKSQRKFMGSQAGLTEIGTETFFSSLLAVENETLSSIP